MNILKKMKTKYTSLTEWRKDFPKHYDYAKRKDLIDTICSINNWVKPINKNINNINLIKQLEIIKEFKTKFPNVYDACIRNKWLREVCSHMVMCKPNHYWTKELCLTEALKYSRKTQFQKNSNAAFVAARRNK